MSSPKLGVIVVNFGSHELLATHLGALAAHSPEALIVVVDNFSDAVERAAVTALAEQRDWLLVAPRENTGFGGGCNLGAQAALAANCEQLLFLNPDASIDRDSLTLLRSAVVADPWTIAAPRILNEQGTLWSAGMDVDLATGDTRPWSRRPEFPDVPTLAWFTGACLLVSRELWQAAGGFDEDYFLYWEDVDFCVRAQAVGGTLQLVEAATARHDVGATQAQHRHAGKSETYYYYNIRNRSLFAKKHLDSATRRRWRRTAPRAAWRILRRGGRRQFLRPRVPLRAWWRGLRDSDHGL